MALHLTNAVVDGSKRVLTRTGGVLFALLLIQQALLLTSLNTVLAAEAPPAAADVIGVTLPVSGTVAGAILVATFLFTGVYFVALSRAFTRPATQLSAFPAELYTRRIGRASLSMLLGGAVVSIAITVGFAFLFLPGLFLAACFLCFIFAVGVEDRGILGALRRSWRLSRGNRLRLGVIVFAVGVCGTLVGVVPTALQLAGAPALGDAATVLLNATLFVFVYGVMAAAYLQLADDEGRMGGPGASTAANTGGTPEL